VICSSHIHKFDAWINFLGITHNISQPGSLEPDRLQQSQTGRVKI